MNIKPEELDFNDKVTCLLLDHIEEGFYNEYKGEWEVVDEYKQHPQGWDFADFVQKRHPSIYPLLMAYAEWKSDMYDGVSE
jgi:hypothetical protein